MGWLEQARSNIGNNLDVIGSYLGLPETGLSEKIAGGATANSQNWINSAQAADNPTYEAPYNVSGQYAPGNYQGALDFRNQQTVSPTSTPAPTSSPTNTGGGGGSSLRDQFNAFRSSGGYAGWGENEAWADFNAKGGNVGGGGGGPSQEEIDAQFNPIFDVYNQAESNLRSQQPGLISEAEAQAQASRQLLGNQRLNANELLGQQEQATTTQQQRQSAQQRQTLQELQLANQQRFGGASSAGLGASELQGREFQRSQFGIQENAQQALQAIGQQKQQVQREYDQGLQQLEVNKQQAVNEIQRKFQDKLLEINARRGETESAKAQARLSALQELRNQAYQINVARMQFENDLKLQAQANNSYLDQAANQFLNAGQAGQSAVNQFGATTPTGMSTVNQSAQQTQGLTPTGYMSKQPEDQYIGSIAGSSATDPRYQNYQPFSAAR